MFLINLSLLHFSTLPKITHLVLMNQPLHNNATISLKNLHMKCISACTLLTEIKLYPFLKHTTSHICKTIPTPLRTAHHLRIFLSSLSKPLWNPLNLHQIIPLAPLQVIPTGSPAAHLHPLRALRGRGTERRRIRRTKENKFLPKYLQSNNSKP